VVKTTGGWAVSEPSTTFAGGVRGWMVGSLKGNNK
jgi:hypothetical protein